MWNSVTGSNKTKRTLRILIVTSVTVCIFVIYVKRSKTFSDYNEFYPVSRNMTNVMANVSSISPYSKGNFKPDDVNVTSERARAAVTKQLTAVGYGSNKRNTLQTLLNSEFELRDINSSEITTLTSVTNATEKEQGINWRNMYSTEDPASTEVPSRGVHVYSNRKDKANRKLPIFSRKTDSDSVVNWSKFQHISFRQKARQKAMQRMPLDLPYFQTFDKAAYDIMNMKPITFDPAFKNPCWRGGDRSTPLNDGTLHCLPYFYLIGVKKSGTTDLFSRIQRHAEFCKPLFSKESQWFARIRFGINARSLTNNNMRSIIQRGIDPRKVEFFISLFDKAARCISFSPSTRRRNDSLRYKMVTAEASPSTFHMHTNWERLPGNENLTEPRYTNFHFIKHITPNVKIIILFRDPATRLYSDFLHTTGGRYGRSSPEVFHRDVTELIKAYKGCFRRFSQRRCVYNNTLKQELRWKRTRLAESFNAGFYAVLMRDLLEVFGKAQVLPVLMTDYIAKMEETLRNVFSFLDMSAVNSITMRRMLKTDPQNVSKKKKAGAMLDKTRDMLYDFYRPYNEDMAALMNDTRYLFPKT
ncbi:carbohydrate sulfotransferase 15-like [Mercenaria mercenaria]|uniref:carbohydrate sulfotransferase 15-like n=1 Tax=Mercenaria mercenaria TaxID=6596 RepID=UPI00234F96FF|nr:carbohydrate sulfotransferase 15-like [Mercenaria mercenaria]